MNFILFYVRNISKKYYFQGKRVQNAYNLQGGGEGGLFLSWYKRKAISEGTASLTLKGK